MTLWQSRLSAHSRILRHLGLHFAGISVIHADLEVKQPTHNAEGARPSEQIAAVQCLRWDFWGGAARGLGENAKNTAPTLHACAHPAWYRPSQTTTRSHCSAAGLQLICQSRQSDDPRYVTGLSTHKSSHLIMHQLGYALLVSSLLSIQ